MLRSSKRAKGQSSLVSAGARVQFAIGVSLISVIPLLAVWYLHLVGGVENIAFDVRSIMIVLLVLLAGGSGYLILRKYPVNIVKLRGYLERMIYGQLPDQVSLLKAEDDIAVVEKCLNVIIGQLRERLEILQQEKKALQQQLFQVQKMESLGVMAAGAAHDFNNLLMGMLGNINFLSEHIPTDSPARMNVREMETLVQRASDLTKQMLVYSGRGRFQMEKVDVSALVRDMSQLLRSQVGRGVEILYDVTDGLPPVEADPTQMRQVIMNLVLNASEAIGTVGGTITVATRKVHCDPKTFVDECVSGKPPEGECVCLEVADTGCGIDAEKRASIFDPFFSTKPKGRGLGLAVVLGVLSAHRGAIMVESEPGKGSRFVCLVPAAGRAPARA